jgi:hypothetical protein
MIKSTGWSKALSIGIVIWIVMWIVIIWFIVFVSGCQRPQINILEGHLYFVPADVNVPTIEGDVMTVIRTKHDMVLMSEFYLTEMFEVELPERR